MKDRERLLTIGIGGLMVIVACCLTWSYIYGQFEEKSTRLERVEKDLSKKKLEQLSVQKASKRLSEYEAKSLPRDVDLARSLYSTWLLRTADQDVKLKLVEVQPLAVRPIRGTYQRMSFSLVGRGTISQMADLLYRFHSADWLHRIDSLRIEPVKNSKEVDLSLTISAASVNTAAKSEALPTRIDQDFVSKPLSYYLDPILERNKFRPPNQTPRIDSPSRAQSIVKKSFETTFKGVDPDAVDQVEYRLTKNSEPPAKLDPKTGRFTWTPPSKGDFKFEIEVLDDGIPRQKSAHTFTLSVVDPPPPPEEKPVEVVKKPMFDHAKHTYLTAVVSADDEPQAWLNTRTTGETYKLHRGDSFEIGSIKAEIAEIDEASVLLTVDGKPRRLYKGDKLFDAATTATETP